MATVEVYTSIHDAPLDEYTTPDEGDFKSPKALVRPTSKLKATQKSLIVPFTHNIRNGSKGKDVIGVKRAIWKANGLKVPTGATELFGPTAVKELKFFQKKHRLPADGVLGQVTLKKLAPFFDAYAFLLYEGYKPGTNPIQAKRDLFVAYMLWAYNNKTRIHYLQRRPMQGMNDLQHLPVYEDCSEFYTKGCKYAGFPDPNGFNYNGIGNTATIAAHGKRVTISAALPGAGCLYGYSPDYEHVAGIVAAKTSKAKARVVSNGSEPGPFLLEYDYRDDMNLVTDILLR